MSTTTTKQHTSLIALFFIFFFTSLVTYSQSDRPKFSGALLYSSTENDLYIWTENLDNRRINVRIGNKNGEVSDERNFTGVSAETMNVYSYFHPLKKQLYILFHPNWLYTSSRDILIPYELYIINMESKKIVKSILINQAKSFQVAKSEVYPKKELLFFDAGEINSVKYFDFSKDSLYTVSDVSKLTFCFNDYAIMKKNVVKKGETVAAYFLYDINNKKLLDKELDYEESQKGTALDYNGKLLIQMKDDKDKVFYKEVNVVKQKLEKEKVENPISSAEHQPMTYFMAGPNKEFDLVSYNFKAFLKSGSLEEKLAFADITMNKIKNNNNALEINYITQTLFDIINKYPNDSRIQKWLERIYKKEELSYEARIDLLKIAVDKGILSDKMFADVFKYLNEKTSGTVVKKAILDFAKKGYETIKFSDYTDRLVTKFEIATLEVFVSNYADYSEYAKIEKLAKKQDTTATSSFIANYEGKLPKILIGQLYYQLAESNRIKHEKTQDSLIKIKVLNLFERAFENEFDSDEWYVGYMRTLLFLNHDFTKADSVLKQFMLKYGNLSQTKTWFTNYPFNAGVEAFKIGNYSLATAYLTTYLNNDKNYQRDAQLRLFEAALRSMNWEIAKKSALFLDYEMDKNELEAYFPDYERWKSCLESQNLTNLPSKSNLILIQENQHVYTEAKKGMSSGLNSSLKVMEKQALFFDSIGVEKFAKEAWIQLGSYHFKKNNFQSALNVYKQCMEKIPTDFECHKNYILTLLQNRETNKAREMAESLYATNPNDLNVRKACGQVYNQIASESTSYGDDAKTIELFEKSLSFDENEVTCLFLAYYYKKIGKYSKKDEMVKRAKAVNPNVFYDYPDFKTLLGM